MDRPSVTSAETPRIRRSATGSLNAAPLIVTPRKTVRAPGFGDSGQTTLPDRRKKDPCGCPRRTTRSGPEGSVNMWTSPTPPSAAPCSHVAMPFRTSGFRQLLGQNIPSCCCFAAPICVREPTRESHAQIVKSSQFDSEWYSRHTSHRPSNEPPAWSVSGFGNALIRFTSFVSASIRATPEKSKVQIEAKKVRPSRAGASGTIEAVRDSGTTL